MNIIRTVALKMAILIVIMVATIGSWEVIKAKVKLVPQASAQLTAPPPTSGPGFDHLTCYMIARKDNIPPEATHSLTVENQFGPQDVRTSASRFLCVPTTKRTLDGQPAPDPDPSVNLPHFKCYLAVTPKGPDVLLADEFMTQEYSVLGGTGTLSSLFCNPVEKTVLKPTAGG